MRGWRYEVSSYLALLDCAACSKYKSMNEKINTKILDKIKGLGYYQIIGGLLVFWSLIKYLFGIGNLTGSLFVLVLLAMSMFSFSIYCGILVLNNFKKGLKYSSINQLLQSITFSFGSYYYLFGSGLLLVLGIDITENMDFMFKLKSSTFNLGVNPNRYNLYLGINIIALYLIYFIGQISEKLKIEESKSINDI